MEINYFQPHALQLGSLLTLRLVAGVQIEFLPRILSSAWHETACLITQVDYQVASVLFQILLDFLFLSPDNVLISTKSILMGLETVFKCQ